MRWDSSKRKYETTCHLTHSEQPLQLLRTFEHEGSLQVVATTNNSIFRYTFTEDPCIYRDSHIDLIELFKSEAYTKIIDLAIFNNT
jgi:adenosine deaminase